jgi:hypothetical protein
MTLLVGRFQLDDYETWKREMFDRDVAGRRQTAKGHRIMRNVDDPNQVFVQVEFASADDARAFRDRLMSSDAFEGVEVLTEPTVIEEADAQRY